MEPSEGDENESSSSQHNTRWKQFQAKAKPLLSPKLSAREPEEKKERGMWVFKRMKRKESVALDRAISSSQPDLLFSSQGDVETKDAPLCGKARASGSALGREKPSSSSSLSSKNRPARPNKPTVSQLVQCHHKSSSLGSACLERLAEPPGGGEAATAAAAAEPQLESRDEQPVSFCQSTTPAAKVFRQVCGRLENTQNIKVKSLDHHTDQIKLRAGSKSISEMITLAADYQQKQL